MVTDETIAMRTNHKQENRRRLCPQQHHAHISSTDYLSGLLLGREQNTDEEDEVVRMSSENRADNRYLSLPLFISSVSIDTRWKDDTDEEKDADRENVIFLSKAPPLDHWMILADKQNANRHRATQKSVKPRSLQLNLNFYCAVINLEKRTAHLALRMILDLYSFISECNICMNASLAQSSNWRGYFSLSVSLSGENKKTTTQENRAFETQTTLANEYDRSANWIMLTFI